MLAVRLSISSVNLSRIERGRDLRVSTLLDIARELSFEPMLIPKEHVPAIQAILKSFASGDEPEIERPRFG